MNIADAPWEEPGESAGDPDEINFWLTTSRAVGGDPRLERSDWLVENLVLHERLNEVYSAWLTMASGDPDLRVQGLLGADVLLEMDRGGLVRPFCGVISRVEDGGVYQQLVGTRVLIEPAFALMRHRINTRIFQNESARAILERVLSEGLATYGRTVDLEPLGEQYPTREYCVQYQESDFDFCCRLMEEEGIGFHFAHEAGGIEVLTLTDSNTQFLSIATRDQPNPRPGEQSAAMVRFVSLGGSLATGESVSSLKRTKEIVPTGVWVRDYDWSNPTRPIDEVQESENIRGREHYDHSQEVTVGDYDQGSRRYTSGQDSARNQSELRRRRQTQRESVGRGVSYVTGFAPGRTFTLVEHPHLDMNAEYVIVGVSHNKNTSSGDVIDEATENPAYYNTFECVPAWVRYVPERRRRKPRIQSVQTARVCGPETGEPHTDEHGRVKLHFHWDRDVGNTFEAENTCWVRVSQPMAGAGWGHQFIPHVGMEVVVSFVNGDPDRPLVVGTVYNGENAAPFPMPEGALNSGLKSVRGNELRMSDVLGEEEIYLHAQRDLREVVEKKHSTTVKSSQSNTVYGGQTESVGGNQSLTVHHDRTKTVKGNETVTIEMDRTKTIVGNETTKVDVNRTETVGGDETIDVLGARTETVTMLETITLNAGREMFITPTDTFSVDGDKTDEVSNNYMVNVQTMYCLSQGDTSFTLQGNETLLDGGAKIQIRNAGGRVGIFPGGTVSVAANGELALLCGGSSITLRADGIKLAIGSSAIELLDGEIKINGAKVTAEGTSELVLIGAQMKGN